MTVINTLLIRYTVSGPARPAGKKEALPQGPQKFCYYY